MLSVSSCSTLPPYAPSSPVPSYTPAPGPDEILVEQAPRVKARAFTGTHIKKFGPDTVVLTNQDPSAEVPNYGRGGLITGFVDLGEREKVSEVVVKLKGKIEGRINERGSVSRKVLDATCTLWSSQSAGTIACPSTIPFSVVLPAKYQQDDHAAFPLPPSYSATFLSMGGISVKIAYSLSVVVTRNRGRKLASFISFKNTTTVPFTYSPRTRPWRPVQSPTTSFLSDVKLMPEEWRQTTTVAHGRRQKSAIAVPLAPLDLHLFTPAVEVFGLEDAIPVHVQLTGALPSLREFLLDAGAGTGVAEVQVTLLRQLLIQIDDVLEPCRQTLGRSVLAPTPPSSVPQYRTDDGAALDWTGELRCMPGIAVGSFDAGVVKVQDFVVVDIRPGPHARFPPVRHSHPVRLVTDSWPDEYS